MEPALQPQRAHREPKRCLRRQHRLVARRVDPIYGPPLEGGEILLYAGELEVRNGEQSRTLHGQVELRLFPSSDLKAHVAGSGIDLFRVTIGASDAQATTVPNGVDLNPPNASTLPERQPDNTQWAESWIDAQGLTGGELGLAERVLIQYNGALDPLIRRLTDVEGGGSQGQISFELPGWSLVLAPIPKDDRLEGGFAGAIEATPTDGRIERADVDRLGYRLFAILSLIATREVAIGPDLRPGLLRPRRLGPLGRATDAARTRSRMVPSGSDSDGAAGFGSGIRAPDRGPSPRRRL